MEYGYGRVSTNQQDTALQEDAFRRAGVRRVVTEKWSGVGVRPELRKLIAGLRPGDRVTVYKLDRLGRSLQDLLAILERIDAAGARFRSLTEPIDTTTPAGKLMYSVLGAVAEFERSIIRERTLAGQAAARERGRYVGRPPHLTLKQCEQVAKLLSRGHAVDALADRFGVNPWVIKRAPLRLQN